MARFMDFHEDLKLPAKTASPASKTSKPKAIGALRRLQKRHGLVWAVFATPTCVTFPHNAKSVGPLMHSLIIRPGLSTAAADPSS